MVRARKTVIKETSHGDHRHLQEDRLERVHRRNRHPQRPDQERPHRPRCPLHRRERPQPPRLRRPSRDRRRLVQALQRGSRLSRPEAGRPELHRPDLRQPFRRRGRRRLQPHLVPAQPPQWRLSHHRCPVRITGRGITPVGIQSASQPETPDHPGKMTPRLFSCTNP